MSEYSPELVEKKNKQRLALRKEYLKQLTDPHSQDRGHIFDPALQRYLSLRATRYEFFRDTPKTAFRGIAVMGIPLALTMYCFWKARTDQEALYRSGAISYRDRLFKFQ